MRRFFFTLMVCLCTLGIAHGQQTVTTNDYSSSGKSFHFSFLQNRLDSDGQVGQENEDGHELLGDWLNPVTCRIYIANNSSEDASVTINFSGEAIHYEDENGHHIAEENLAEGITVGENSTRTIVPVPDATLPSGADPGGPDMSVIQPSTMGKENKVFSIISDKDISVYTESSQGKGRDGSLILSDQALGSDYIVSSYTPSPNLSIHPDGSTTIRVGGPGLISVVAKESTTVKVTLPDGVESVSSNMSNDNEFSGGEFGLNEGEVYQIQSDHADLSGTHIESIDNEKIAVFAGNMAALIKSGEDHTGAFDHVYEQMIPTHAWGCKYIGGPLQYPDNATDVYRIYAFEDETDIDINGERVTTLNKGEFIEQTYDNDRDVTNTPLMFEGSSKIMVAQYAVSASNRDFYFGNSGRNHDPMMMMLSPVDQAVNKAQFASLPYVSENNVKPVNNVYIVTKTDETAEILLDGQRIDDWIPVDGDSDAEYSYADVRLSEPSESPEIHSIETSNDDVKFNAYAYGFDEKEAYGYPVGINATPVVAEVPETVCANEPIQLQAFGGESEEDYTWSRADGAEPAGLSCVHCSDPVATVDEPVTYVVNVNVEGSCDKTGELTINVTPGSEYPAFSVDQETFHIHENNVDPVDMTGDFIINESNLNDLSMSYYTDAELTQPVDDPSSITECGTYYVVANEEQCQHVEEVEVMCMPCQAELHITEDITLPSNTVWSDKVYIDDNVTVTVNNSATLDITNTDVIFGLCAGIEFEDDARLRANNSVFRPCDENEGWQGLTFTDNSEARIHDCVFKNAHTANRFSDNTSNVEVHNSLFLNCEYGIEMDEADVTGSILNNEFSLNNNFPSGDCSPFRYARFVNVNNSRLEGKITNNDVTNSNSSTVPRINYGIYSMSSTIKEMSSNTFSDVYYGFYFNNSSMSTVEENIVNAINYGIYAYRSSDFQVINNTINGAERYGIFSFYSNHINISCNEIDLDQFDGSLYRGVGIRFYVTDENSRITSNCIKNTVNAMYLSSAYNYRDVLPELRNNFMYNYGQYGIYSRNISAKIGTSSKPGMNTFYSNSDAVDVSSQNGELVLYDNFSVSNYEYPGVVIASNKESYSTAGCANTVFGVNNQENWSADLICEDESFLEPVPGSKLAVDLQEKPLNYESQKGQIINTKEETFNVFPNPASSQVTVEFVNDAEQLNGTMSIKSVSGQQIVQQAVNTVSGQVILDIENIKPGLYIIIMEDQDGNMIGKSKFSKTE